MSTELLARHFGRMGATLRATENSPRSPVPYTVNVVDDEFILGIRPGADVEFNVQHLLRAERHLVLFARNGATNEKQKFLCGHDERHWFAAALPKDQPVRTVQDAWEVLKPTGVRTLVKVSGMRIKEKNRRRNEVFLRQGEWFFIPQPSLVINPLDILRNEPLSRSRGKAHMLQEAARVGGERVYVLGNRIMKAEEFDRRYRKGDELVRRSGWMVRVRNPGVYARGTVRHADHATIHLPFWHQVVQNGETDAVRGGVLQYFD